MNFYKRDFNFQITQPDTIDASYTFIEPSCFGYTDGSISTSLSGGTSPYNYAWSNGITTQDNVAITSGNYDLTITDNNGCVFVLNTVLTQPLQIQVTFDANYLEGCDPLDVKLTNTSEEQFLSTWNFDDGETAIGSQVDHVFTGAGCYDITLEVTDANGCFNSATYSDFICVLVTPIAEIGVTNTELGVAYPETTITNLSINADSYSWNMGDNSVEYNFFEPGNYTFPTYNNDFYLVSLIAYNNNGCVDYAEVLITYDNSLIMYVPNTFTPNGDENNQVFKPVLPSNVSDFKMKIYNRWGQLIFESFEFDLGWDGTFNGIPVQDGTYTWDIFVRTHDAYTYKKQGIVNVMR
jgi:gliding motility-associated-like protein